MVRNREIGHIYVHLSKLQWYFPTCHKISLTISMEISLDKEVTAGSSSEHFSGTLGIKSFQSTVQ
jgi:hypothetical protein